MILVSKSRFEPDAARAPEGLRVHLRTASRARVHKMVLQGAGAELHATDGTSVPVRRHARSALGALEGRLLGRREADTTRAIFAGLGDESAAGRTLIQKEGDLPVVAGRLPGGIG
jgi:hypothetical protein